MGEGIVAQSIAEDMIFNFAKKIRELRDLNDAELHRRAAHLTDQLFGVDDPGARSFPPVPRVHSHRQDDGD